MLFIIHVYLIMCLWACDKVVATQLLKDDSLKARENYLFGTEINQSSAFGTKKFELSYLAQS